MVKGHSTTMRADMCSKGISTTINAEKVMARNEIVKAEKAIAKEREKISASIAHIEKDLSPALQVAKVRIIFSKSLR